MTTEKGSEVPNTTIPITTVSLANFQILQELGQGAFGKVFAGKALSPLKEKLGRSRNLERNGGLVALKQLCKQKTVTNLWRLKSACRENNLLQHLHGSPLCIQHLCSFQTASHLYLVTDFYNGGSLHIYLRRHRQIAKPSPFTYLAAELVSGLGFIHKKGIVHRDLKPANIMLNGEGHAVIIDFGHAFYKDSDSEAYKAVGTPLFHAPEMFDGRQRLNEMIDWWALGLTLLMTLTGKNPLKNLMYRGEKQPRNIQELHKIRFIPVCFPTPLRSFLKGLLTVDRRHRLGASKGTEEIKQHAFFKTLLPTPAHWEQSAQHQLPAPVLPCRLPRFYPRQEMEPIPVEPTSPQTDFPEVAFPDFDVPPASLPSENKDGGVDEAMEG